jgi:hypothetical protein
VRRIGFVTRVLCRVTDPLFRRVGMSLGPDGDPLFRQASVNLDE